MPFVRRIPIAAKLSSEEQSQSTLYRSHDLIYDSLLAALNCCANKSFKWSTTIFLVIELEVNQDEQIKSSGRINTDNNNNNKVNPNEDLEKERKLLLRILRQRQLVTDSETGKLINDDTDTQTLLRIIQEEKEKEDRMKMKDLPEASINTDILPCMKEILQYYAIPHNLWHRSYCSIRDMTTELTMMWLLLLAINPLTGWFFHPFVFGWIQ